MKINNIKYSTIAAAALLISSCSNKNDVNAPIDNIPADGSVRITTVLNGMKTRANGEASTYTGTNLSLSVDYGVGNRYTNNNMIWITADNGTTWTPGQQMLWKDATTQCNIYAYAPFVGGVADMTAVPFSVAADQTSGLITSDLVGCMKANYIPFTDNVKKAVALEFDHKLSKLTVNCSTFGNEFGSAPVIASITLLNTNTAATYNATTAVATAATSVQLGSIKMHSATATSFECILVPQTISALTPMLQIALADGRTFEYKVPAATNHQFVAGTAYTLSLRIGKDRIEVGEVSVSPWDNGGEIGGGQAEQDVDIWDGTVATSFAGGTGTESDPYLITTGAQLAILMNENFEYAKHYKLCKNIDLAYRKWIPIGSNYNDATDYYQSAFSGTFDGDGHTIYRLNVTGDEKIRLVGLFGNIMRNYEKTNLPSVCNLTIERARIYPAPTTTDMSEGAGILAGQINSGYFDNEYNNPLISNCHVSGTIYADYSCCWVGGLVGFATASIFRNCSVNVTINGNKATIAGGFIGWIDCSDIENCSAKGEISGQWSIGGFIGLAESRTPLGKCQKAIINNCTTSASINASNWNVGGFVGFNVATITNCTASGNLNSTPNWPSHTYKTGGFVGTNTGTISSSTYSGTMTFVDEAQYYGGFIGFDKEGSTSNCRFDGAKNSTVNANGLSTINEIIGTNDIMNSLE